jgi:NADH-quinone oxidoreductase subunit M
MQRVLHGPLQTNTFTDLRPGEWMIVAPAIALMFALGIWPNLILNFTHATIASFAAQLAN